MNSCSLLIPCYNAEKYLPRLWETVKAQIVPFDEIICYDDGSNDNTASVARSLGARVIRSDVSLGAAQARNQLSRASKYSWFHFHDADDLLQPEYLQKVKSRINNNVDVILCNVDWIDAETRNLIISFKYIENELKQNPVNYTLSHPIGGINGLYRKEAFLSIGGFDESMKVWEDADLHVRLANAGAEFAVVEEVLAISLRHPSTTSHNYIVNWQSRFQALKKYAYQLDSKFSQEISTQAEIAARSLLDLEDQKTAVESIKLCISLGGKPPKTNNLFFEALKLFLPPLWLFQLQKFIRRRIVFRQL